MQNERFYKEVKKGLPDSLYFLWSKEQYFLDEVLQSAIEVVVAPAQRDFNYDVFYPSTDTQEILDTASTLPFLAQRRLVVLKDFHQFSSSQIKALIPYFIRPSETTCMLILSLKEPKLDIDISRRVYSLKIREKDIPEWLRQMAVKKRVKLSESAVEYLIESVGLDIGLLAMEVEKLTLSGLKTIDSEDVISSTGRTRDYISFDFIDALIAGQKSRAFRILKTLVEGKPANAPAVLGALNWHYRQFYTLWMSKGKKPAKMKNATFKTLYKYLPYYTQKNFCEIFQSMHEADVGIKTSGRPELALEILLIKLLQIGTKN